MNKIFEDREKDFEAKYKHDEELRFKIIVRRDKLLGLWAAKELKRSDAEAYAKSLVDLAIDRPGDQNLVTKLAADFTAAKIEMSEHRIRTHLEACFEEARHQIMTETK